MVVLPRFCTAKPVVPPIGVGEADVQLVEGGACADADEAASSRRGRSCRHWRRRRIWRGSCSCRARRRPGRRPTRPVCPRRALHSCSGRGQRVVGRRPTAQRVGVGGLERIRNARQLHARLLALAAPVEANAQPSRLAARKEIERKPFGRRRSEKHVVAAVRAYNDVLRFLPERIGTLRFAIHRKRDGFDRRDRQSVGRDEIFR